MPTLPFNHHNYRIHSNRTYALIYCPLYLHLHLLVTPIEKFLHKKLAKNSHKSMAYTHYDDYVETAIRRVWQVPNARVNLL